MSLPQFIQQVVSESTTTTIQQLVRVVNNIITNLNQIFTYLKTKQQLDTIQLTQVPLKIGTNQVAHTLGKTLTGWQITRLRGNASIYDTQDTNPNKNTYLQLVSNANVVVDIIVY